MTQTILRSLVLRLGRTALWLSPVAVSWPAPLLGQDSTGVLQVRVLSAADSTPLGGAFVRSGRVSGTTDPAGLVRVNLGATLAGITVSRPGFATRVFEMTILPAVVQRAEIYLPILGDLTNRVVQVSRAATAATEDPTPVVLLNPGDVTDALERRPGDLLGLIDGPGIHEQPLSGAVDATQIRLRGLKGQYTGLLIDGLPLQGSRLGSFGLLQLSPIDLDGVEILLGAATPYHGPGVGAGAINLISRRPDRDRIRLAVDQSSEKGGDIAIWGAKRFSPRVGATTVVDFHQQRLADQDEDSWGEFPRAIRFALRPRIYLDSPNGDGLMVTAGGMTEDRTGGFLVSTADPNPYREERQTRRIDGGLAAHHLDASGGRWELSMATVFQSTSHRFDAARERDRRVFLFGELWYRRPLGKATVTAGLGYQRETLREQELQAFDFTHTVPSVFTRAVFPFSKKVTAALTGRCDYHSVHGTECMPGASVLLRPAANTQIRLSFGEGYVAPTPLTDDVEAIGLRVTVPVLAKAERFRTGSIDFRRAAGRVEWSGQLAYSRIALPVRLIPFSGDPTRLLLINVPGSTRMISGSLAASLDLAPVSARIYYSYLKGTEGIPGGTGRRETALTPRHSFGAEGTWSLPGPGGGAPAINLNLQYIGSQSVVDNPFLTRTPGYLLSSGVASLRSGKARLFLSGQNLFDKKLRNYQLVVLPDIAVGGRRTTSPWIPLRGRVISVGAVVDW